VRFMAYLCPTIAWSLSLSVGMRLIQGFTIETYIMTRFAASSLVAVGDLLLFNTRFTMRQIACLALLVVLSVAQFCREAHASRWSWPIHRYLLLPMSTVMFVADSLLSKRVVTRLREHHRQTTLGICIVQNLLSLPILIVLIAITEEARSTAELFSGLYSGDHEASVWTQKAGLSCLLCCGMSLSMIVMNARLTAAHVSMVINFNKVKGFLLWPGNGKAEARPEIRDLGLVGVAAACGVVFSMSSRPTKPSKNATEMLTVLQHDEFRVVNLTQVRADRWHNALLLGMSLNLLRASIDSRASERFHRRSQRHSSASALRRSRTSTLENSRRSLNKSSPVGRSQDPSRTSEACRHILSTADEYYRAGYQRQAQRFAEMCIDTCRDSAPLADGETQRQFRETELRAWLLLCMSLGRAGCHAQAVSKGLEGGQRMKTLLTGDRRGETSLCKVIRGFWDEDKYEVPPKSATYKRTENVVHRFLEDRKNQRLELGRCASHLLDADDEDSTGVTLLGTLWQVVGTEMQYCGGRPLGLGNKLARELVYSGWELIAAVKGEDSLDERRAHDALSRFLEQKSISLSERSVESLQTSKSSMRTRTASTMAPSSTAASGMYTRSIEDSTRSRSGRLRSRPGTDFRDDRPNSMFSLPRPTTTVRQKSFRPQESCSDEHASAVTCDSACDALVAITINRALLRRDEESLRQALAFISEQGREASFQLMADRLRFELKSIKRERETRRLKEYLAGIRGEDIDIFELLEVIDGLPRSVWSSPEHSRLLRELRKCVEKRLQKAIETKCVNKIQTAIDEVSQILTTGAHLNCGLNSAILHAKGELNRLRSNNRRERPSCVPSRSDSDANSDPDATDNSNEQRAVDVEQALPLAELEQLGPVDGVRQALTYRFGSLTAAYYHFCDDEESFRLMSPFKFRRALEEELNVPWEVCAGHSDFRQFFDEFELEKNGDLGATGLIGFVPSEEHDTPEVEWKRYLHIKAASNARCETFALNGRRSPRWDNKEEYLSIMNNLKDKPATQEMKLRDFWRNQDNLLSWKSRKTEMEREFRFSRLRSKKQPQKAKRLPPLTEQITRDLAKKGAIAESEKKSEEARSLRVQGFIKDMYQSRKDLMDTSKKLRNELETADPNRFRGLLLGPGGDEDGGGAGFFSYFSDAFSKSQE
ncbi:hypothetical protein FOZ62_021990, partial [Perkinsus olseni]